MGVKLASLVKGTPVTSKDLHGKRFAIDASHTLMQFLKRKYANSSDIATDRTQRAIPHLYGVFYRTIRLLENQILPVYCFDGKSNKMKQRAFQSSLSEFRQATHLHESMMEHNLTDQAKKIALSPAYLWKNTIRETKQLLTAMGIPYLISPTEGEAQCAQLVKMRVCDYVVSSDFDVLLYGAPLLKIDQIKGKKIFATVYTPDELLKSNGITRFQLVDLSILIGNDYTSGIKGIGPKKGIALLKKHGSIEKIPNIGIDKDIVDSIRSLFLFPQVLTKLPELAVGFPNRGGILELMTIDHSLNNERVNKGIERLKKSYEAIKKSTTIRKLFL
jgi:flap endonuclease-1